MKDAKNIIPVNCECLDTLKLSEIHEFQGGLKVRDDEDVNKIVKSIKKYGFSFPFFVWKHDGINEILDGHGRVQALRKLDELGFLIPDLPVVYVNCKDEQSARDLLLRLNSHYGKMTKETVMEFIGDFEIETSDLELPCGTIDFSDEERPVLEPEEGEDRKDSLEVVVACHNQTEQEELFYRLVNEGYNVKTR